MARTIVIGLDSADLRLVDQWIASGDLPCLGELFRTGSVVGLDTVSRALQGSVWPSLLTGVGPGHHGMYLFRQLVNGTYKLADTYADHVSQPRFYDYLMDAGLRCGVADIPGDRPRPGFAGLQVVDWGTEFHYWGYATVPRTFTRTLRRIGRNPLTHHRSSGDSQPEHRVLCRKLGESIRLKTALGRYLIERTDLDCITFVFGEPHKAGHWLWKYHDHSYVDHEPAPDDLRHGLLNIYRRVDEALGELLALLEVGDNLLVFSDHGMQAAYRGDHLLEPILERLGMLAYRQGASAVPPDRRGPAATGRFVRASRNVARRVLPESLAIAAARYADSFPLLDWQHTRAFRLPTDRNSYVRLNLAGREPRGVVAPEDYHAELDLLERTMHDLVNVDTGTPAVDAVYRVHRDFPGPRGNDLPDLAIRWAANGPIVMVRSPQVGTVTGSVRELRSGNHREEGFLVARGPGFRRIPARLRGDILQIAPTILQLHGVALPDLFEMPPLWQILPPGLAAAGG